MPAVRYRKIQTNFTTGEVSPRLLARTDLDTYESAVKTMENVFSLPHGGAKKRPGTVYVGEVYNSSRPVRLIPFVYSTTQSYVIVLNGGRAEFVTNGGYVMNGASRAYVSVPFSDSELPNITHAQYGSSMFLAHPNHQPRQLQRTGSVTWTLSALNFTYNALADFWFENGYVRFKIITTGTGFNVGDYFQFTTNGSGGVSSGPVFTGTGTGAMVAISVNATNDAAVTWTAACVFSSATRQEFDVYRNISPQRIPCKWGPNDYPAAVAFYEQRLWFAGNTTRPQTVYGSQIGDFSEFTLGPDADDGVEFTIASNQFDQILHLEATRNLLPMSYGGEFSISGTQSSGITPQGVLVRGHTTHGSTSVRPIRVGEEVLFVQRDKRKVRAISYDVTLDANTAPDITLLAEHITGSVGIADMAYAQSPEGVVWAIRNDGVMLSCTHLRNQNVTAWARHATDGTFERVCALPTPNGDEVYTSVRRTINGSTKRYIEQLNFNIYNDCSLTGTSGTAKTVWTGLTHLEGKTVSILADGKVHKDLTVSSGSITLDYGASTLQVGLPYTSTLELLHPNIALADGTSQGSVVSVHEAIIRVQDSVGIAVDGQPIPIMKTTETMDSAPVPYTGDVSVRLAGYSTTQNLKITHDLPQPFTVLGVIMKLVVGE